MDKCLQKGFLQDVFGVSRVGRDLQAQLVDSLLVAIHQLFKSLELARLRSLNQAHITVSCGYLPFCRQAHRANHFAASARLSSSDVLPPPKIPSARAASKTSPTTSPSTITAGTPEILHSAAASWPSRLSMSSSRKSNPRRSRSPAQSRLATGQRGHQLAVRSTTVLAIASLLDGTLQQFARGHTDKTLSTAVHPALQTIVRAGASLRVNVYTVDSDGGRTQETQARRVFRRFHLLHLDFSRNAERPHRSLDQSIGFLVRWATRKV